MALANYADLQASVANWLHRSDMAAIIPDLIVLAEKRINGDLDARLQDAAATLQTVAGNPVVALPTDTINLRSLTVKTTVNVVLDYLTPDQFNTQFSSNISGLPLAFSVIGASLYLGPTPDAVYSLQCIYKASVPALSAGTNWLMTSYPQVYLAATMCAAALYTKDNELLKTWEVAYAEAIKSVNAIDWYSGSTMRVRTDVRY